MNLDAGIKYNGHARFRMRMRAVTEGMVEQVLRSYHTSYPAGPLPGDPTGVTVYVATIDGRDLKVYEGVR